MKQREGKHPFKHMRNQWLSGQYVGAVPKSFKTHLPLQAYNSQSFLSGLWQPTCCPDDSMMVPLQNTCLWHKWAVANMQVSAKKKNCLLRLWGQLKRKEKREKKKKLDNLVLHCTRTHTYTHWSTNTRWKATLSCAYNLILKDDAYHNSFSTYQKFYNTTVLTKLSWSMQLFVYCSFNIT